MKNLLKSQIEKLAKDENVDFNTAANAVQSAAIGTAKEDRVIELVSELKLERL